MIKKRYSIAEIIGIVVKHHVFKCIVCLINASTLVVTPLNVHYDRVQ